MEANYFNFNAVLFKFLKFGLGALLFSLLIYLTVSFGVNTFNLESSTLEKKVLTLKVSKINITSLSDIKILREEVLLKIKDSVSDDLKQRYNLNAISIFNRGYGSCYDRSYIFHKILRLNNIKTRPVYVYFNLISTTNFFDIFFKKTESHNLLEFYYDGRWILLTPNKNDGKWSTNLTLEAYLGSNANCPSHSKYIKHLFSRNFNLLPPNFLPDFF